MKCVKTITWFAAALLLPVAGFAQEGPAVVPTDMVWIMNVVVSHRRFLGLFYGLWLRYA